MSYCSSTMLRDGDFHGGEAVKFGLVNMDDVDFGSGLHGLLDTQIEDGLTLIGVGADKDDVRGFLYIDDAIGHHPGTTGERVTGAGEVAVMVINVRCADDFAQELLEEIGFFVGGTG